MLPRTKRLSEAATRTPDVRRHDPPKLSFAWLPILAAPTQCRPVLSKAAVARPARPLHTVARRFATCPSCLSRTSLCSAGLSVARLPSDPKRHGPAARPRPGTPGAALAYPGLPDQAFPEQDCHCEPMLAGAGPLVTPGSPTPTFHSCLCIPGSSRGLHS